MRVQFHVTEEDIRDGVPWDLSGCPVALAILDLFPDADVEVIGRSIWIDGLFYPASEEVADLVQGYDIGEPVRPTSFTLDLPEEYRP